MPKEIYEGKRVILHVSDTPSILNCALRHLVRTIKPSHIIHTGDLVDNVKLELFPNELGTYRNGLSRLLSILENSDASVYLSLGNHDDLETVRALVTKSKVYEADGDLVIEGKRYHISHYYNQDDLNESDFWLYGHDVSKHSCFEDGRYYLNGIDAVNIIDIDTGSVYGLPYPVGTNDARLRLGKRGL